MMKYIFELEFFILFTHTCEIKNEMYVLTSTKITISYHLRSSTQK
jgi:hypothetical protein